MPRGLPGPSLSTLRHSHSEPGCLAGPAPSLRQPLRVGEQIGPAPTQAGLAPLFLLRTPKPNAHSAHYPDSNMRARPQGQSPRCERSCVNLGKLTGLSVPPFPCL